MKRANIDRLGCLGWDGPSHEREVVSIGKKMGPTMSCLGLTNVKHGNWEWISTISRNTQGCTSQRRSKNDIAIRVPVASAPPARICQRLHGPASQVDRLQLVVGKKGDAIAIWGPEWKLGAFRTVQ